MTGSPHMPTKNEMDRREHQQDILTALRQHGLHDTEISPLVVAVKSLTIASWRIGKTLASPANIERLEVAAEISKITEAALRRHHQLGHIGLLLSTSQPILANSTPADYICEHGIAAYDKLLTVSEAFVTAVTQGLIKLSEAQIKQATRVANFRPNQRLVEEAAKLVDQLIGVGFSFREINDFIVAPTKLDDIAGELHNRTRLSVEDIVLFKLKQAAFAADGLIGLYGRNTRAIMLRRGNGKSIIEAIAAADVSRTRASVSVKSAVRNLNERKVWL